MKSGCSPFPDGLSVNLFLGNSFGKSEIAEPKGSLRNYKEVLEIPWEKKYQVEFDFCLLSNFLARSVVATSEVAGRRRQQVIRKWTSLRTDRPDTEGRKGRAGWTRAAQGRGAVRAEPRRGRWCCSGRLSVGKRGTETWER